VGDQHGKPLPQQLRPRVAKTPLRLRVDQHDLAVAADDHHRVGGRLHQPPELLLRPLALGDVLDQTVVVVQPAGIVAVADDRVADPAKAAVSMTEAVLNGWYGPARQRPGHVLLDRLPIVRMDHIEPQIRLDA